MFFIAIGLIVSIGICHADDKPECELFCNLIQWLFLILIHFTDKMCVPELIYSACTELVEKTQSQFAQIRCVAGRDRMECLEKVEKREADFVAVDPEDMYVAFQMKNEDFSVFSEIRNVDEPNGNMRWRHPVIIPAIHCSISIPGQHNFATKESFWCIRIRRFVRWPICVAKNRVTPATVVMSATKFRSPNWRNTAYWKSRPARHCHRWKRNWKDCRSYSASRVWWGSIHRKMMSINCSVRINIDRCVVVTFEWSLIRFVLHFAEKRYANLCALCEDPVKCDYPDKYSGYEGAIRCLVERNADVAFTKVIYVNRFFGVSGCLRNRTKRKRSKSN